MAKLPTPKENRFKQYDNVYSSFFITYVRPLHRSIQRLRRGVHGRLSTALFVGLQAEQFPDLHRNCPERDADSSRLSSVDFLAQGSP